MILNFLEINNSFLIWGPGILVRGGFKNFKVVGQFIYLIPLKSGLQLDNMNLSLGIAAPFKIKPVNK